MACLRLLTLLISLFLQVRTQSSQYYDCSGGVQDGQLTQQIPYKGCYTPGQGVFAASANQTTAAFDNTTWVCDEEVYTVVGARTFTPWATPNGQIDCSTSSTCTQSVSNTSQECFTVSNAIGYSIGVGILDQFVLGITGGETISTTTSQESCSSLGTRGDCSWSDDSCHAICISHPMLGMYGYKVVKCYNHTNGLPPSKEIGSDETTQGQDDGTVVCMQDWVAYTPILNIPQNMSCDGGCQGADPCGSLTAPYPTYGQSSSCFQPADPIWPNASTGVPPSIAIGVQREPAMYSLMIVCIATVVISCTFMP